MLEGFLPAVHSLAVTFEIFFTERLRQNVRRLNLGVNRMDCDKPSVHVGAEVEEPIV
jgi:hypothetical protein